jgi:hypothetical protein
MTDDKSDDILEDDVLEADFDNASTDDLKKGQDKDDTGDAPNGGK